MNNNQLFFILATIFMSVSAVALLLWWLVLAIFGKRFAYVVRVQAVLSLIALIFTCLGMFSHHIKVMLRGSVLLYIPLFACLSGMLALIVFSKQRTLWGAAVYLLLLTCLVWFHDIVGYIKSYYADEIPLFPVNLSFNHWDTLSVLVIVMIGVASVLATFRIKDTKGKA